MKCMSHRGASTLESARFGTISNMSLQVCNCCGWSKVTTYQGLRTHQGKMGCTQKGMRIPESEQFRRSYLPKYTYLGPSIKVEEPFTNIFSPSIKSVVEQNVWRNLWDEPQDSGPINSSQVRKENVPVSPNLTTQMITTDAALMQMFTSLFETQQHLSTDSNQTHRALDFSSGAQPFVMPVSQTLSTQANPDASEVMMKQTSKSFFETPQRSHQTATNFDKVHQAHDFSTGAQQPFKMPVSQTPSNQNNPAVKETNKSLFETPQHSHQSTTKACRGLDFSAAAQQVEPLVWDLPTTTAQETTVPKKEEEREAQKLLKNVALPPYSTTQMMPAATEAAIETTTSLSETQQPSHQTATKTRRALDFSAGAQQVGQMIWDVPTTTAQETAVRPTAKEIKKEREAQKLLQARQDRISADLQQKIQMRQQKIAEVRSSVKASKGSLDTEWLEINNVFSEVARVVEDARQKALQPLEERRQILKREARDLVQKLQKEIDKLKKTIDVLDKNPDLQVSLLTGLDESRDWNNVAVDTSFSFGTLRTTTSNMMEQIHQKLENLSSVELKRIPTFAVDVKLDPTTAHRCLVLSADGKKVRDGAKNQKVPDAPERFDMFGSVLGLNRLSSGKSYWEVDVSKKTGWDLGVARRDANRKGKLSLTPDNGYWVTVHYEDEKYAALTAPPVSLSLTVKPQKVGVFVDYEEGLVSFYDVTAQSHFYSFTECSFSGEVFPYFSPHLIQNELNSDPLIISDVKKP
ncbi:uncharacterized protein LOC123980394 [Micropterus dolomieu]|uniref:uncharacterized protein LOC123980394 n=3 Tax=Micropterus TaxID=27705 RepID=UPI001E8E492B|nr:uncharacterized protein LOC123980394 [Micropterus dolomieu]